MAQLVIDDLTISQLFSQMETLIQSSREQAYNITQKYSALDSYSDLMKNKNLLKLYGDTADDFSRLCFLRQGISEAIMDVKSIKREIAKDTSMLVPSMVKSYKYRSDSIIESLELLKDSVDNAKQGMEARVRYLNSVTYGSYDKFSTTKC